MDHTSHAIFIMAQSGFKESWSDLHPWHILRLTSIYPSTGSDSQVLHQIWGSWCCLDLRQHVNMWTVFVFLCIQVCTWEGVCVCVCVFECGGVFLCVCVCHVRVIQAVLLLWYRLNFTEPPLGGRTTVPPASRHLSLSHISWDLQKHKQKSSSVSEHHHNLSIKCPQWRGWLKFCILGDSRAPCCFITCVV